MFLMLTFNYFTPFCSVSICDIEQVNVSLQEAAFLKHCLIRPHFELLYLTIVKKI